MARRAPARYYPWILAFLVLFYYLLSQVLNISPIWSIIPVAVAGWFYYRRGGLIAGLLALPFNLFLIGRFDFEMSIARYFEITNGFAEGHIFIVFSGLVVGFLREEFENFHRSEVKNRTRERQLTLINLTVKDILESRDLALHEVYDRTLNHLCNLFVADFGYMVSLNEAAQEVVLVASTRYMPIPPVGSVVKWEESVIARQALTSGRGLILQDAQTSPLIAESPLFRQEHASVRSLLAFPLVTKDYKFGAVILAFEDPRTFDLEEIGHFELVSSQVTLALRSVQQERRIAKQFRESQALAAIERALSESERIGLDAVLQRIVNSARELIPNTTHAILHLLDEEQRHLVPRAFAGEYAQSRSKLKMQVGEGIAGLVISSGETIAIPDVRTDPRFLQQTLPVTYRSLIVSPVQINKKRIGTISIHSNEVGIFDRNDIELLSSLGSQVAIAIENADLLEATRQNLREINALYHVSRSMASTLDPKQVVAETVEFLQKIFKYYHIQVFLLDGETLKAYHGIGVIGNRLAEDGFSMPVGTGIIGQVAQTREPFFTNDVGEAAFFVRNPLLPETQSEMALPILADERLLGVLDVQETGHTPISLRHMKLMNMVCRQMALSLQKVNLINDLQTSLSQEKMMRSQLLQNERLVVVGRLLASISHELNNPLQAIQNVLFLLKGEKNLSEQGRQDLEVILSETERMNSLISRLRTTYRTPQYEEFKDLQLNSIIEDIYALTATYMRHKKIAFEFHPDMDLPVIPGIPDQVRQVLLNLFMNAIDAMHAGGHLIVQTRTLPDGKQVLLSVSDTGTGIAPDILPQIFDPFVTDKDTGTGLGLTITRDIIRQHNGEIQAHNRPEGGAEFRVWLPAIREAQP